MANDYCRTLLKNFLELKRVPYHHHAHPPAFTASQLAATERVPAEIVAKTVVLKADGQFVMAVLPATKRINLQALGQSLGSHYLRLATENEFRELFPDSDLGAMPPFGNLYELPVCAEKSLAEHKEMLFNAGTHKDSIQMTYEDFARVVQPTVCAFAAG
jgi:Ala-tRNA(Pro) deacylase